MHQLVETRYKHNKHDKQDASISWNTI